MDVLAFGERKGEAVVKAAVLPAAGRHGSDRAFHDIITSGPAKRVPLFLKLGFA